MYYSSFAVSACFARVIRLLGLRAHIAKNFSHSDTAAQRRVERMKRRDSASELTANR
jgi:hypothetical protein